MKVKVLESEGRSIPFVFCEVCEKPIDKGDVAEYLIPVTAEGEYSDIVVGHTKCTKAFERMARGNGIVYGNMSLGHLIYCLGVNQGIDLESEKESSDMLSLIG